MTKIVQNINDHPIRVLEQIQQASKVLGRVRFSENINDLALARTAPMSAIWACLESGQIRKEHIHREPQGLYAKLYHDFAGTFVTVDVMLDGKEILHVLFAEAEEY